MAITAGTPIALNSDALSTVALYKLQNGITSDELLVDGLTLYHDGSGGAAAATVFKAGDTLTIDDDVSSPTAIDLTAAGSDTIAELVTTINAVTGWIAVAQTHSEAASTDLRDFASVSAFGIANIQTLQIEDNSSIIILINAASEMVTRILDTPIAKVTETHKLRSDMEGVIAYPTIPLIAVLRVSHGECDYFTVKNTDSDAFKATVRFDDVTADHLVLTIYGGANNGEDKLDITAAGNDTIGELVTAINALSAKGWSATIGSQTNMANAPSAWLIPFGARECLNASVGVIGPEDPLCEYHIHDHAAGLISGLIRDQIHVVEGTGGYATIPDDVQWGVNQMVKDLVDTRNRDGSLASERLGDYSWAASQTSRLKISDAIMERIGTYARLLGGTVV